MKLNINQLKQFIKKTLNEAQSFSVEDLNLEAAGFNLAQWASNSEGPTAPETLRQMSHSLSKTSLNRSLIRQKLFKLGHFIAECSAQNMEDINTGDLRKAVYDFMKILVQIEEFQKGEPTKPTEELPKLYEMLLNK
jgi:replication initiation and membrane attachment protein DnaB